MFCPNCGKKINDGDAFCGECGFRIENNGMNASYNQNQQQFQNLGFSFNNMGNMNASFNNNRNVADNSVISYNSIEDVLVEPTENVIATYGNSYVQNFVVSKDASQFAFILTNKRVYFKGCGIQSVGYQVVISSNESIIDLEDITGTTFKHFSPFNVQMIVMGIVFLLIGIIMYSVISNIGYGFGDILKGIFIWLIIIGIFFILLVFIEAVLGKHTNFCIEYAGGSIFANVKIFGVQSAHDFNRQIRRAKDKICGK